ncbi:MAG: hypothetical protein WC845_01485 [Candidatus Staskawiczbacteria bacterium]|jgi:cation:H+ antiporter
MLTIYLITFLVSCALFYIAGKMVVDGLIRITKFLRFKEFVVAFFVMAFAASLPNLVVGISSALQGIPQLSFGDVTGNNLAALTLAIAIVCLFAKRGVSARGQTVRTSSLFVMASALLPLVLIFDGTLSRMDGILLIALFVFYIVWLFSKKERFTKPYDEYRAPRKKDFGFLIYDSLKIVFGLVIFIVAAQGIVVSAKFFASSFDMSLILIGILITGLGSALPEIYFDVISARRNENWMILGDLMGAIIIPSTLVLGIVTMIAPIHIFDFSSLALARFFIVIAAVLFPFFLRSGRKIDKREALILLGVYILFLISEILLHDPLINNPNFQFLFK